MPAHDTMLSRSWRRLLRFRSSNRVTALEFLAMFALAAIVVLSILAPFIAPQDPYDLAQIDLMDSRLPPGSQSMSGTIYWLGTDDQGRDLLSGILYGARISVVIGLLSTAISIVVGGGVGLLAAFAGGRVDAYLMRIVDLQLSFPAILVALILIAMLGRGADKILLALIVVQWAYYARTMRGVALAERGKTYIKAASALGLSPARVMFRHLLPNCLGPIFVLGSVQIAHAIALEATLSFLGLGLPVTEPSLGLLVSNGFAYMLSGRYWISFYPGLALFVLLACLNLVADVVRRSLDRSG